MTGFYRGTALSTVLPGAGLFRVNKPLAWAIVAIFASVIVGLGVMVLRRGALRAVIDIGVSSEKLLWAMIAVGALAAVWIFGIVVTALLRRPRRRVGRDSLLMTVFTAVMCVVVLVPTAFALQGLSIQRRTLGAIVTDTNRPATTGSGATDAPVSADPWEGRPRVNLLLLGSDAGPGRTGVRPDSIMVASIDTKTGDTILIGLPRNLERVPIPERNPLSQVWPYGFNCGSECMLSSIWTMAEDRPDLFPDDPSPGLTTTRDVVSEITGLEIDDSVVIDLRGFEQLVNAMGGVTINATERVSIGGRVENGQIRGITGWIEPGVQHMDGYHALWYARSRATTDDFSRMRRQRCVVGAIVDQVDPVRMLARYPQLAQAIQDNLLVDIPADDLAAWAELVLRMKDGRIQSLPITNQVVNTANPDFEKIRTLVAEALEPQPEPEETAEPEPEETGETSDETPEPEPTETEEESAPDELADLATTC